uniref:Immunoglobulin V-set domain-containing protein n=1 Tax=Hucho hucho TaxID=62062 RepID=A0A4W5KUU2_9TELE
TVASIEHTTFLCCDAKTSKIGAHGYEGGALDIECSYPDGYQYKPKYLCRHPCSNSDILIRSVKGEIFVPVGRFSVYDNVHGCTFIVTIQNLELQDSGHYYCGLDKWGRDILTKVEISVSYSVLFQTHTGKQLFNYSHCNLGFVRVHVVVGAVLGLLMCCTVVALGLLLRKQSMSRSLSKTKYSLFDSLPTYHIVVMKILLFCL